MRKRLLAFMTAVIMLGGCAAADSTSTGTKKQNGMQQGMAGQSQSGAAVSDEIKNNATRIITGTVQSIVGNEATLLVTKESSGAGNAAASADKKHSGSNEDRIYINPGSEPASGAADSESVKFDDRIALLNDCAESQTNAAKPQAKSEKQQKGTKQGRDSKKSKDSGDASDKGQNTDGAAEKPETLLLPVGMSIGTKDYTTVTAGSSITVYFGLHPDDGSEIITAVELSGGRR